MVERDFSYLYKNFHETLTSTDLQGFSRSMLWEECANTMTYLEVMQVKIGEKSPYELFYKRPPKLIKNLVRWGKRCIIKDGYRKIRRKLKNRGTKEMFVGYFPHHPRGTLRFIKENNRQFVVTRNYTWSHEERNDIIQEFPVEIKPKEKEIIESDDYQIDTKIEVMDHVEKTRHKSTESKIRDHNRVLEYFPVTTRFSWWFRCYKKTQKNKRVGIYNEDGKWSRYK